MKSKISILALALSIVLLVTSCSSGSTGGDTASAATHDTLTVAITSDLPNIDPHNNVSLMSMAIEFVVYDRLVEKDVDGNIVPSVATEWEIIDDTTVRFKLRDDVYFQNGEQLTADDVKYSITRAETSASSKSFFGYFDGEGCTVIDDFTIDIKTYESFAPMFSYLASARGSIVCQSAIEEMGDDAYGRNPVGSGPFMLESWTSGDSLVFTLNEDYWGYKPEYSTLVCRVITEQSSRAIELETGGVDLSFNVAIEDVPLLDENPDTYTVLVPSYTTAAMLINSETYSYLSDVRVREALSIAIDVESLVSAVYGESAAVADSIFSSQLMGHASVGPIDYDPERAKELLVEAGFDMSQVIEIHLADDVRNSTSAEIIHNMWEAIGLDVEIVTTDAATMQEELATKSAPIMIMTSNASAGDPDHGMYNWSADYGVHSSDEITSLIAQGKTTFDEDERIAIYAELQQVCFDYYGFVPLAYPMSIYGASSEIESFHAHPGYNPNLSQVVFK